VPNGREAAGQLEPRRPTGSRRGTPTMVTVDRVLNKTVLHPTDEGTPQGGIISPYWQNMTLDGLKRLLKEHFPKGSAFRDTR